MQREYPTLPVPEMGVQRHPEGIRRPARSHALPPARPSFAATMWWWAVHGADAAVTVRLAGESSQMMHGGLPQHGGRQVLP